VGSAGDRLLRIDFAGIARLFTPKMENEPNEVWYLFGAWLPPQ
jgi:hypothetical protein